MKTGIFLLAALFLLLTAGSGHADDVFNFCRSQYPDFDENKRCQVEQAEAKRRFQEFPEEITRKCTEEAYVPPRRVYIDYVAALECAELEMKLLELSGDRMDRRSDGGY